MYAVPCGVTIGQDLRGLRTHPPVRGDVRRRSKEHSMRLDTVAIPGESGSGSGTMSAAEKTGATWCYAPARERDSSPLERDEVSGSRYLRGKIEASDGKIVAGGHSGTGLYHETDAGFRELMFPWRFEHCAETRCYTMSVTEFNASAGSSASWFKAGDETDLNAQDDPYEVWLLIEDILDEWHKDYMSREMPCRWKCVESFAESVGMSTGQIIRLCTRYGVGFREDDDDVVFVDWPEFCAALKRAVNETVYRQTPTYTETKRPTTVYFVRARTTGLVKIGCTSNLDGRVKELKSMSGDVLDLLGTEPGGIARERELHRQFSDHRKHGEWFAPAAELLAYIKQLKRAR
jgi:hypothetical protein